MQRRFRLVGVNRLTLSKIDETRHLGNLVNVPRVGTPPAFVSDGRPVPGGSRRPTPAGWRR